MDEARFLLSYKGLKCNGEGIVMPRKPRRKPDKKYLFMKDDVISVICSIDGSDNIISEAACLGGMETEDIFHTLKDGIVGGLATKYLSHYLLWFKWLKKKVDLREILSKLYFIRGRISIREFRYVKPAFACRA